MEAAPSSQFEPHTNAGRLLRTLLGYGLPLAAGLALRLWVLRVCFEVDDDALVYGGIAKNLLLHGRYALNGAGNEPYPTLIRLPGYPLFLALCFRLFGMENYFAPCLRSDRRSTSSPAFCWPISSRRIAQPPQNGAALATLWLAALCPFTASYAAMPLTEAPTIFCSRWHCGPMARFRDRPGWMLALWLHLRRHLRARSCVPTARWPPWLLRRLWSSAFAAALISRRAKLESVHGRRLLPHGHCALRHLGGPQLEDVPRL